MASDSPHERPAPPTPTAARVDRLRRKLRLDTPLIALYDAAPAPDFEPLITARGSACCYSFYSRWMRGETLVMQGASDPDEKPRHGCPAAQRFFGLDKRPPMRDLAQQLSAGEGAPRGEGIKASPEIVQAYLDASTPPAPSSGHVLLGPLRVEQWEAVRTITFYVDPDRLAAVMTLASYWSSEPDQVTAPFSSGCGLLWRNLEHEEGDRAVISCTDIAMRKYLPAHILGFTVSATRFSQMVDFPDDAFLNRSWWTQLMDHRDRHAGAAIVDRDFPHSPQKKS